jgi:hypothetical protein
MPNPNYQIATIEDSTWPHLHQTPQVDSSPSASAFMTNFSLPINVWTSDIEAQSTPEQFLYLWPNILGDRTLTGIGSIAYSSSPIYIFFSDIEGQSTTDDLLFRTLADQWRRETRHISSDHDIALNPAYQRIIGMGDRAIPLILRDLQSNTEPSHWFWALTAISQENPIPSDEIGHIQRMRERWLEWGHRRRYL